MRCSICVLCGLPGAGKSTVAKYLNEDTPKGGFSFLHVCYDELMPSVNHASEISDSVSAWKTARSGIIRSIDNLVSFIQGECDLMTPVEDKNIVRCELESLFEKVEQCDKDDNIVFLVDDNMHYRGMRHEYQHLCEKHNIGFCTVYFQCPIEVCHQRNESRINHVPREVIEKLNRQFEIPGQGAKAKWEKYVLIINMGDSHLNMDIADRIRALIKQSIDDPVEPKASKNNEEIEKTRAVNRENFVHQSDICMRKFITMKMKECKLKNTPSEHMREMSQFLNGAKKNLLAILKMGYIDEDAFLQNESFDLPLLQTKIYELMEFEFVRKKF